MTSNHTSRMAALLGRLRREMNGAVVEAMEQAGVKGVLNYGVSIPTIRAIAEGEEQDYDFAKFLYRQEVRELRMAAVTIADPEQLVAKELEFWLEFNPTLELLDELAQRLLSRASHEIRVLIMEQWLRSEREIAVYTALRVATRSNDIELNMIHSSVSDALSRFADSMDVARAALALYTMRLSGEELPTLPQTASAEFLIREYNALFF